jgi:hypothetical protein
MSREARDRIDDGDLQVAHRAGATVTMTPGGARILLGFADVDGRLFAAAGLAPDAARELAGVLVRAADAVAQPGISGAVN